MFLIYNCMYAVFWYTNEDLCTSLKNVKKYHDFQWVIYIFKNVVMVYYFILIILLVSIYILFAINNLLKIQLTTFLEQSSISRIIPRWQAWSILKAYDIDFLTTNSRKVFLTNLQNIRLPTVSATSI